MMVNMFNNRSGVKYCELYITYCIVQVKDYVMLQHFETTKPQHYFVSKYRNITTFFNSTDLYTHHRILLPDMIFESKNSKIRFAWLK